ncbi:MAG: [protein-PII] uridylyltransferase [Albidovulum sp.]|nr:[protein-PII] uridylyltransferase [Albidovulum sp.]
MPDSRTPLPDAIPDGLICAPEFIFDSDSVLRDLTKIAKSGRFDDEMAKWMGVRLVAAFDCGMEAIAESFNRQPFASREAVASFTFLNDRIVQTIYEMSVAHLHPGSNLVGDEPIAILAVGGYGRGDMAPYSDVDLLFLTEGELSDLTKTRIESMLYMLWDLKLKVGQSIRTIKDCIKLGRGDFTIRTALLEHRYVCGHMPFAKELRTRLKSDLFRNTGPEFVEAKLSERNERIIRQSGNRYVLEPNVKEGKGGLRDLQTLFWIVKYLHAVDDTRELAEIGFFRDEELEKFVKAESFLLAVRCHLHLLAGRAQDLLSFEHQVDVAARLGYSDGGGRRAVEHFMQDYFRHATAVGELTRIFLTKLEAQHVKREAFITGLLKSARTRFARRTKSGYPIVNGRIGVEDEKAFLADPLNILRLFEEGLATGLLLHPDAMRLVAANLDLIDEDFRVNSEANRIFLDLLIDHGNPERALRRMNELGVLSAFMPEFRNIVAMMQFTNFHRYTVDEHTIQCVSNLAQIERGELTEDLPIVSSILKQGINRRVLYIAVLLHDIGKGRDEDHSVVGARYARAVAPRLGLDEDESDTVEWLVRNHLLMNDVAQKRDISDPRTVRDFARKVGNRSRLKLLLVLTVCDIRGVGPDVWSNWKAQLLRRLYHFTHEALSEGIEDWDFRSSSEEAQNALAAVLPDWDKDKLGKEFKRHYIPYWQNLSTESHATFAKLLDGLGPDEIRSSLELDKGRDATKCCFALADHPGTFSRLACALALAGANVVDAKTYTSSDSFATAVFWIQDESGRPYDKGRQTRLRKIVAQIMSGEVTTRSAIRDRDRLKTQASTGKRERKFLVPTEITFDNDGSDICTIIEVDTRDRPGLLYDLTSTLYSANVSIASAVIATYGPQAVDVFYVKDLSGLKLHSRSRRASLERKLLDAIEEGMEKSSE